MSLDVLFHFLEQRRVSRAAVQVARFILAQVHLLLDPLVARLGTLGGVDRGLEATNFTV